MLEQLKKLREKVRERLEIVPKILYDVFDDNYSLDVSETKKTIKGHVFLADGATIFFSKNWTKKEQKILQNYKVLNVSRNNFIDAFKVPNVKKYKITVSENGEITIFGESKKGGKLNQIERVFSLAKKTVKHENLFLKDAPKGYGKELWKRQIDLYDKMGIKKIETQAVDVGRYVWAKSGFRAEKEQAKIVLQSFKRLLKRMKIKHLKIGENVLNDIANLTLPRKKLEKIRWFFSGHTAPGNKDERFFSGDNFLIGKYFLAQHSPTYLATLSLNKDSPDRKILEKRIGTLEIKEKAEKEGKGKKEVEKILADKGYIAPIDTKPEKKQEKKATERPGLAKKTVLPTSGQKRKCGAMTKKGKPCTRIAGPSGRCWQHGGKGGAIKMLRERISRQING